MGAHGIHGCPWNPWVPMESMVTNGIHGYPWNPWAHMESSGWGHFAKRSRRALRSCTLYKSCHSFVAPAVDVVAGPRKVREAGRRIQLGDETCVPIVLEKSGSVHIPHLRKATDFHAHRRDGSARDSASATSRLGCPVHHDLLAKRCVHVTAQVQLRPQRLRHMPGRRIAHRPRAPQLNALWQETSWPIVRHENIDQARAIKGLQEQGALLFRPARCSLLKESDQRA
mmetsp:Transcript_21514/g.73714  ORF Transcript_21514/g.73714 Transcript_21514/m.73714 type:complete len:227 (-) Transcript_21514:1096-1776(-)